MAEQTYSEEGPQCPYCERQYTADDGGYYDVSNYTEEICDQCGKKFSVEVHISTSWTCEPIVDG
jgi:transposase-like protein